MNAIIPFPSSSGTNTITMSSREIAELVDSRHDKVKQSIERLAERGVITLPPMGEVSNIGPGPSTIEVYNVGKRDSYVIVAQLSPEFTARLVDRWQELEAGSSPRLPDFTNPAVAARAWADEVEAKERAVALVAVKERQLEIAAPKVDFVDRYVQSSGLMGFREVCKTLRVKEPVFRDFLEQKRIMYRKGSGRKVRWYPYADHLKAGRFEVKTKIVAGTDRTMVDVYFTAEGFHHFGKMWARSQDTGVAFFG